MALLSTLVYVFKKLLTVCLRVLVPRLNFLLSVYIQLVTLKLL